MNAPLTHVIARNTFQNLLTQGVLIVVALWSLPIVVKGLSNDGFGLLSLVWAFIGYFTLLDFGISRANTKFLAEALATGNSILIRELIWTSLWVTLLLGVLSGAAIVLATPFLVSDLFKISPMLTGEATRAFVIAGIGVPFMLVFGTLKGFQMALQRFEIVNVFQGLTGIVQWAGSVALLWWGCGLKELILLTVGLRVVLAFIAFITLPRLIPGVFDTISLVNRVALKKLMSFGGWVTVSQVVSPLFIYLDRVFIGMFLSLAAVTYYSVPQEALTRVLVLPMSLTATLFPAMSEQSILSSEESKTGILYYRSVKYLVVVMLPLVLAFLLFTPEVVSLWLGKEFAAKSVVIFQILAVGLFFNSVSQIPTTVLHALGRPDLTAKFHLIELPIMVALNLLLIPWIGVIGAAITWSLRVMIDAILLFIASQRQVDRFSRGSEAGYFHSRSSLWPVVVLTAVIAVFFVSNSTVKIAAALVIGSLYIVTIWFHSFDELDRKFFMNLHSRMFG